ncbi:rhomboid family intramembrane serine protease [Acidiferrimicrobium sp. IK]|uniref:rhomboid family intramembrane serine protease n=1 Tax=Acidiferrimicrobium sp. IK TaxID=2871700 RepID=UPI0021CB1C35|nr:rhomboid family intramembrane serine protease [Acidiferrimicrobium sp. IK]MCU4183075.1 rhomboid family intramembrane serine protease [Acidiferrimicrobium sp. IK]
MSLGVDSFCYQHPDRIAGGRCGRCHRPICPECMREAGTAPAGRSAPASWSCERCASGEPPPAPAPRWRPRRAAAAGTRRRTPALGTSRLTPVVMAIIAVNVLVYLGTAHDQASVDARFDMLPLAIANGQWYRLVTAAFLHLNVGHIFFNMVTLAIIGPAVETALGRVRFLALYLLAALGGSIASYLLGPLLTQSVGASGAIFGVMGAYLVLARRSGNETRTVLALIAINLVIGFAEPGIDWRAHIGGLATSMVVAYGFSRAAELRRQAVRLGEVATVVVTAVVLAGIAQLPAGHVNL